jgi:hypothetical protein
LYEDTTLSINLQAEQRPDVASGRVSGKRASHFRVIKRERRACDGSVGAGYLRNDD